MRNIYLIQNSYGILDSNLSAFKYSLELIKNFIEHYIFIDKADDLISTLNRVYEKIEIVNTNVNNIDVFIGGDHSTSIATISKVYKPGMKLIWIDAHADINTTKTSLSNNYHGMPLAILTGLETINTDFDLPVVPFSDILYIGIRSLDPEEEKTIIRNNIKILDSSLGNYQEIIKDFVGDNAVFISFDVDALGFDIMPSTGIDVTGGGGLQLEKSKNLFEYLFTFNIVGLDIMELDMELGSVSEKITSLRTLFYILCSWDIFINTEFLENSIEDKLI